MKAGLTVLVAIASASVNAHVKVETVNFDEDLLNTEKNIPGTFAWKEKTSEGEEEKTSAKRDINVTFKFEAKDIVRKYEKYQGVWYECTGDLTVAPASAIPGFICLVEYSDVKLVFERLSYPKASNFNLYVQLQNEKSLRRLMCDILDRTGKDPEHTFLNVAENYEKMQNLYMNSQDKTETMEWTISDKLQDYTWTVDNIGFAMKNLQPKKTE